MIKMLQCFFGITPLIALLFAPSYAHSPSEEISIENSTKSLKAPLVKKVMHDFYNKFPPKFPIRNIEKEFKLVVDSSNAAQALALALITGGEAPQADALYHKYYDSGDKNIETEEDADKRADVILGYQSELNKYGEVQPEQKALLNNPFGGIQRD
ncbi:MAG: hypothetical protein IBJ00_07730, partial [Alphaproteobacteria bacterium]|nr:hypothetical protein [Alphaproteobacteria bacterium]